MKAADAVKLSNEKKAECESKQERLRVEREERERVWEENRPLRVALYYEGFISQIEKAIKESDGSLRELRFYDVQEHEALKKRFRDDGYRVIEQETQSEGIANYEMGTGNGIFTIVYSLIVKW